MIKLANGNVKQYVLCFHDQNPPKFTRLQDFILTLTMPLVFPFREKPIKSWVELSKCLTLNRR